MSSLKEKARSCNRVHIDKIEEPFIIFIKDRNISLYVQIEEMQLYLSENKIKAKFHAESITP